MLAWIGFSVVTAAQQRLVYVSLHTLIIIELLHWSIGPTFTELIIDLSCHKCSLSFSLCVSLSHCLSISLSLSSLSFPFLSHFPVLSPPPPPPLPSLRLSLCLSYLPSLPPPHVISPLYLPLPSFPLSFSLSLSPLR